jgi:hypothetical protein
MGNTGKALCPVAFQPDLLLWPNEQSNRGLEPVL